MKNFIFIAFLVISNNLFSQNISINVVGSWIKDIDASTISNAGNDYPSAYTSAANQTQISIGISNKNKPVYIYVHKDDAVWDNSKLILKVRRTSDGTNNNTLVLPALSASSFQTITNTGIISPYLFSCEGYNTIVPLQYEISGLSVLLPVQTYSTTVVYTITN
ncbi:MAG: hypothetical protein ACOH1N_09300 [Lutibacter sp.]